MFFFLFSGWMTFTPRDEIDEILSQPAQIYSILLSGVRITSWLFQESAAQQLKVAHAMAAAVVWTTPSSLQEPGSNWQHVEELRRDLWTSLQLKGKSSGWREKNPDGASYNLVPLIIYKTAGDKHNAGSDALEQDIDRQNVQSTAYCEKRKWFFTPFYTCHYHVSHIQILVDII